MKNIPHSTVRDWTMQRENSGNNHLDDIADNFRVYKGELMTNKEGLFRPLRSDHFTIALVVAGECCIQSNLIEYPLQKNSLFIISPRSVFELKKKNENISVLIVEFTEAFLIASELHKKHIDVLTFVSSRNNPHLILNDSEAKNLETLMIYLLEKNQSADPLSEQEIIQQGFKLFLLEAAASFRKYRGSHFEKLTRKEELLMAFFKLLKEHIYQERSVQYYADALYVSTKHLNTTVKELTKKTCSQLINEMVIGEAKILLNDPAISIAKVADELNFGDQFSFSKFFKKHAGLNPSDYKNTISKP